MRRQGNKKDVDIREKSLRMALEQNTIGAGKTVHQIVAEAEVLYKFLANIQDRIKIVKERKIKKEKEVVTTDNSDEETGSDE